MNKVTDAGAADAETPISLNALIAPALADASKQRRSLRRAIKLGKTAEAENNWLEAARCWGKAAKINRLLPPEEQYPLAAELHGRCKFIAEHGSLFECNICGGKRFRDFKRRVLARCATCKSLERHRYMGLYLDALQISPDMTILHIAPDNGIWRKLFERVGENYYCADIDSARYVGRANFTQIDLCKDIKALDVGGYDIIIHSHIMEHLPCNYVCVMAKLNSLLRPNGRQLVVLPVFDGHFSELIAPQTEEVRNFNRRCHHQVNHVRKFGRENLESTFGMMFDFGPYRKYNMGRIVGRERLIAANIPPVYWAGLNTCTIFDIKKSDFMNY